MQPAVLAHSAMHSPAVETEETESITVPVRQPGTAQYPGFSTTTVLVGVGAVVLYRGQFVSLSMSVHVSVILGVVNSLW